MLKQEDVLEAMFQEHIADKLQENASEGGHVSLLAIRSSRHATYMDASTKRRLKACHPEDESITYLSQLSGLGPSFFECKDQA